MCPTQLLKLLAGAAAAITLGGGTYLSAGCVHYTFQKGSIVVDDGRVATHLGRSVGLNVETSTHIGVGFDEAHTDIDMRGHWETEYAKPQEDVSAADDAAATE